MHAYTQTQTHPRFAVPALIAAAAHAALFLLVRPAPPPLTLLPPDEKVTLRPFPVEMLPPPPPEPTMSTEPAVRPLRGDSAAQTPEPPAAPTKADFVLPAPPRLSVLRPTEIGREIPRQIGVPDGVDGGTRDFSAGIPGLAGVDQLDGAPRARVQVAPAYPMALRRDGIEGVVVVEFAVDTAGRVTTARVRESSHREFEEPTLRAVLRWQFEPGKKSGRVVPFRMTVPVTFRVTE